MQVEIDQSGKIEWTQKPTVLALSNDMRFSILIPANEKRKILLALRQRRSRWSRTFINVSVFSTLLYLLLKDHIGKLSFIVIDPEYQGHEPMIKDRIMTLCRRKGIEVHKDQLTFQRVGKKSPAHNLAIKVFRGKVPPDREISAKEVLAEFGQ